MPTPPKTVRIPPHENFNPAGGEMPKPLQDQTTLPPDVRVRQHINGDVVVETEPNTNSHAKGPLYGEGFTQGRWKGFEKE